MFYAVQEMSPTALFALNISAAADGAINAQVKHVSADLSALGLLNAGRAFNAPSRKSTN